MTPPERAIIEAAQSVGMEAVPVNTLAFQRELAARGYIILPVAGVNYGLGGSRSYPGTLRMTLDGLTIEQGKAAAILLDTYDECARHIGEHAHAVHA